MVTATNYFMTSGVKNKTANLLIDVAVNFLTQLNAIQTIIDYADNSTSQFGSTSAAITDANDSLNTLIDDLGLLIRHKTKTDVDSQTATVIADLTQAITKINAVIEDIKIKYHSDLSSTDGNHVVNYSPSDLNALFEIATSISKNVAITQDNLVHTYLISLRQYSGNDSLLNSFYAHANDFFVNTQAQSAISAVIATNIQELQERWMDYVSNNNIHDHTVLSTYITTIQNGLNTLKSVLTDAFGAIDNGLDQVTTGTEVADTTTVI